jgi:hypothetical protein
MILLCWYLFVSVYKWKICDIRAKGIAQRGNYDVMWLILVTWPQNQSWRAARATTRHQLFCHIWKFHGDNFTRLSCPQFWSVFDGVFCNMAAQTVRMHLPNMGSITWDFVSRDINLSRQRGILVRWGEWMICTYWLETLLCGHVIIFGYLIGSVLTEKCKFVQKSHSPVYTVVIFIQIKISRDAPNCGDQLGVINICALPVAWMWRKA